MDASNRRPSSVEEREPGWLQHHGSRVLLFDIRAGVEAFHRAYFDEVGVGAANYLYQVGQRSIFGLADRIEKVPSAEVFTFGLKHLTALGLGDLHGTIGDLEKGRATVTSLNSTEAWGWKKDKAVADGPVCCYLSGLLAGLWLLVLERTGRSTPPGIVCWESECQASGGKVCRFELGSDSDLDRAGLHDPIGRRAIRWELQGLYQGLEHSQKALGTLQEQLADRQRAYENVLNNMNDQLVVLDHHKRVVFCNRQFLDATGLSRADAIGSSPLTRIHPTDRIRIDTIYDELLSGRRQTSTYRYRGLRAKGIVHIESSARSAPGLGGQPVIEIIGRDITERENSRRELELAHAKLVRKQHVADNDLRVAKLVHESLLPKPIDNNEIALDIQYVPVQRVGGDYCHCWQSAPGLFSMVVCDVSGHGTASALLAARISSFLTSECQHLSNPASIASQVNEFLRHRFSQTGLFATLFAVTLDLTKNELVYFGAGHPPILRWNKSTVGDVQMLESVSLPVGVIDELPTANEPLTPIPFQAGDRLLLYTDGVSETMDVERRPINAAGLAEWCRQTDHLPLLKVGEELLRQLDSYRSGPPLDDMTLIVCERK